MSKNSYQIIINAYTDGNTIIVYDELNKQTSSQKDKKSLITKLKGILN